MNLGESVKFVLKNRSSDLFRNFWKEDIKSILVELAKDLATFTKNRHKKFRLIHFKESFLNSKDNIKETIQIYKVIPSRMKFGLNQFREDFLNELDQLSDPKSKTLFTFKVLGSFSKFILSYGLQNESQFLGVGKYRNTYTQFIVSWLIFKFGRAFVLRFLREVEKEAQDPEDLNRIKYLKTVLEVGSIKLLEDFYDGIIAPEDRASKLVDSLKQYILTGEKNVAEPLP